MALPPPPRPWKTARAEAMLHQPPLSQTRRSSAYSTATRNLVATASLWRYQVMHEVSRHRECPVSSVPAGHVAVRGRERLNRYDDGAVPPYSRALVVPVAGATEW